MRMVQNRKWFKTTVIPVLLCGAMGMFGASASNNEATSGRVIHVPNTNVSVQLWEGADVSGQIKPHYSISLDGKNYSRARATSYDIKLRYAQFDPLSDQKTRSIRPELMAGDDTNLYIVQFVTQPLEVYRQGIRELGGVVYKYLAHHSHIVKMNADVKDAVSQLPYVRWVGQYHPAYRLEEFMLNNVDRAQSMYPSQRYNIMVMESGMSQKVAVTEAIASFGGYVDQVDGGKFLLVATLTPEQLFATARLDEVLFIDRWGPYEVDMDKSRIVSGANYLETVAGYTGEGVRAEIFDNGFNLSHVDFNHHPLIQHGAVGSASHGAATSGIVCGDGTGNPVGRGIMPDAQGIVADYNTIGLEGPTRYQHTGELVDPNLPYKGIFQTASVGSPRTTEYSTISADTDASLFEFDVVHCQSQSNAGDPMSRPQAWAKNIISGGGIYHYDNTNPNDDCWCNGGSTGPATDGRIKPDLCHFYDNIFTTTSGSSTSYTSSFGGTSGATPNICGYTGLFFQMWADDNGTGYGAVFGNQLAVPGGTVFENRAHMTTAKAMMINTANQYPFTGLNHDLTRTHIGWGMPSVQNIYDMREKMLIVNEEDILTNLSSISYVVAVPSDEPQLKATLVYADPAGNPGAQMHRINDLSLKVTSPSGTEYWGNNGLREGNWSTPGGSSNIVDTVENVFVEYPESGAWTIEVFADEIIEDSHVETPELDADFALIVSGGEQGPGFGLSVDPWSQDICAPANAVYDIEVLQFLGFDEPVTLSVTGNPPGTTASFSTNPVIPPGTTTLTISNTSGGTPGDYLMQLDGDTVSQERTVGIGLGLSTAIPGAANLVSPADGATEIARKPLLDWDAATQGTNYDLEISTNSNFTNVVYAASTSDTSHTVQTNLDVFTLYYWRVQADNGCGVGPYSDVFSFTTLDQPDYFTEEFTAFDLNGFAVAIIPDGSGDYYQICGWEIDELPTDPTGGTTLPLSDDDYETVTPGKPVSLYGTSYNSFHVGSNGYITFTAGDTDYSETLEEHFEMPRISGMYDDLNPSTGGLVSWKVDADHVAVTWDGVPEYSATGANTFQISMYFNGEIHIAWLNLTALDGICGLSNGGGVPADYIESDLSASGPCSEPCPADLTGDGIVDINDVFAVLGYWGDCPDPCPPYCTADVNEDCIVDVDDIFAVLGMWGPCE